MPLLDLSSPRFLSIAQYYVPETVLDTLAAAYAEAGRFSEAVKSAEQALALATSQNNVALADALRVRIKLYRTESPYHDTQQPSGSKSIRP